MEEKEIKEEIKKTKKQFEDDSKVPFFKGKPYVQACTDLKLAVYEWCQAESKRLHKVWFGWLNA